MLQQDDDDQIDTLVCSSNCKERTMTFKDNITLVKPLKNDGEIDMVAYAGASLSGSSLSNEGSSSRKVSLPPKSITATTQNNKDSPPQACLKCPRCDSGNTKFCYYNNYNHRQPRYFCKSCRRYWTEGGALRNVPIGGGCRKNKKVKHRTTFMTTTGGIFEPFSYLEDKNLNMLARLNTNFPCFGGPTNFGDDNNRVSVNLDTVSSLNETMYATHLVSSPSFLDMGPLVNNCATSCTIPHCGGTNLCNCASYMNNFDKTLDATSGCDMPMELIEQGTYSTFYDPSSPVMMGGLTSSAPIEDQFTGASNVLPLNYLTPDVCNATIFESTPQVQVLPDDKHIPSAPFSQERENISLTEYYEDSKNITLEQMKKDEESTFFNQVLKELSLQVLYDDQPCRDQPNMHVGDFSEAENKMLLEGLASKEMLGERSTIDTPSTNEQLLTNGPHSNTSWSH